MTTRVFSDEDLERLRSFPEINREELIRFFTLTAADVEFIDPQRGRGPSERLGLAVQLCTSLWLGFVPDDVARRRRPRSPACRSGCRSRWVRFASTESGSRPALTT